MPPIGKVRKIMFYTVFLAENNAFNSFTKSFISYASSFTLKFGGKGSQKGAKLKIMLAPILIENNVSKELIIYYKGGKEGQIERFIDAIRYFRFNKLSTISDIVVVKGIGSEPIREAWGPSYLKVAHESLKKAYPIRKAEKYESCCEHQINVIGGYEKFFSLLLTSLLAGGHRRGIGLRQIAAQNLVALLLTVDKLDEAIVEGVVRGLAALVADVYVWVPKLYSIKKGVWGSEIHYSLAMFGLDTLICWIQSTECFTDKYNDVLLVSYNKLKEAFGNLPKDPMKLAKKASESIKECLPVKFRSEVLLGYYERLTSKLEKAHDNVDGGDGKILLTTVTEQSSLLYITTLMEKFRFKDIVLLYTPQMLYERLLLEDFLEWWNNRRNGRVSATFIPLPGLDAGATYEYVEAILNHYSDEIGLIVAGGPMSLVLPLKILPKKLGLKAPVIIP